MSSKKNRGQTGQAARAREPKRETRPMVSAQRHPIETGKYTLCTPAVEEAWEQVDRWLRCKVAGAMIVGPQRYGKTSCIRQLEYLTRTNYGREMPVFRFLVRKVTTNSPSAAAFYTDLLADAGHSITSGSIADKHYRLCEYLVERISHGRTGRALFLFDDAHRLHAIQYEWLMDIQNRLADAHCRPTFIFIGQPELEHVRSLLSQVNALQVIKRFLGCKFVFNGVRTSDELAEIFDSYDEDSRYPENSDWTFTRFYLPNAYGQGWRLREQAEAVWQAAGELRKSAGATGAFQLPMDITAGVAEQLLQRLRAGEAAVPAIVPQNAIREILEDLGYVESDVDVRLS